MLLVQIRSDLQWPKTFLSMENRASPAGSGSGFVLALPADADSNRPGLRTDIKTDAAPRAPGSAIRNRVVALAIQRFALGQNAGRTSCHAKGAPFAQMNGNLHIATIKIAHKTLPIFDRQNYARNWCKLKCRFCCRVSGDIREAVSAMRTTDLCVT